MIIHNLLYYVLLLPGAFFAPVIHESVKALCSARLGDPTPKRNGFLTGNPFKYFEPVGFLCMLIFGYGWGRPVPTSPLYYKDRRRGVMIAYITPSVVNLLVGIITAVLTGVLNKVVFPPLAASQSSVWIGYAAGYLLQIMYLFAQCNIGLAFFNILPVYPLDGSKILQLFLKPEWAIRVNQNEKIIQVILLILLGLGLVSRVLDPIAAMILRIAL